MRAFWTIAADRFGAVGTPPSATVAEWLESTYPEHGHRAFGRSGAALLFEALRRESRGTVILPAFISFTLSGAATAAGKRVLHLDVDPATLHIRVDFLQAAIASEGAENVIVLVDHAFGYPFPGLGALRRRYPEALFIEDCVRALGGTAGGEPLGRHGDWTLLSLYKTTSGNLNGAILLSRKPLNLPVGESSPPAGRTLAPIRARRRRSCRVAREPYPEPNRNLGALKWSPKLGLPTEACVRRFERWRFYLPQRCEAQRAAAAQIRDALEATPGVDWIRESPDSAGAAHFLSFTVSNREERKRVLIEMSRRGFPLERTWHLVPIHFRGFEGTFPFGSAGSERLSDCVIHVPMAEYLAADPRRRLIDGLRAVFSSESAKEKEG